MDITSLHKYVALNKMANGQTEVIFAGQPCLMISESNTWTILPVFAKLTYGANVIEDIPSCLESYDSLEEAVAGGLTRLYEIGVFSTMTDLPEDSYATTLLDGAEEAKKQVTEDYKILSMKLSPSLFDASRVFNKILSNTFTFTLSESDCDTIKSKLTAKEELTESEKKIVLSSLIAKDKSFISEESGLFIGSSIQFTKYVQETPQETHENAVQEHQIESPIGFTFSSWKAAKAALTEGSTRRLISSHEKDNRSAKVYKDSETGEHVVKFYKDGKHQTEADYFTDGEGAKEDAQGTAKHFISGKTSNVSEGLNDDDYYQVNKTTKKITKHLGKQKVGWEHRNTPEKAPNLADYCDDNHTCLTGMYARTKGYVQEGRESEFDANTHMSSALEKGRAGSPVKKKISLKTPTGSTISTHDSESDAMRAYKSLKDQRGVKFTHESESDDIDVTDWFINEIKNVDDAFAAWEAKVREKHAGKDLKFKGRVEKGTHTTSAEESGKDRSYGVWDHTDNTGHVFESDEGEDIIGEETKSEKKEEKEITSALRKDHKFVSKYADGTRVTKDSK